MESEHQVEIPCQCRVSDFWEAVLQSLEKPPCCRLPNPKGMHLLLLLMLEMVEQRRPLHKHCEGPYTSRGSFS